LLVNSSFIRRSSR